MRSRQFSIFTRIGILFFTVITVLCLLFMGITYLSVSNFHEAGTQLLNKEVATHIAKFTSPFNHNGIDEKKADSVFYNAMVLSPSAEVYFLDSAGNVVAYHANEDEIRLTKIDLTSIKKLIASEGSKYIKGPDPRDPANPKIFSAAEVWNGSRQLGYIYVILGSNKHVNSMLFSTYFSGLIVKVITAIIILSIIFAGLYIRRLQKKYNSMLTILDRFQQGDFTARFPVEVHDEMAPITTAFNTMADLLVVNIDKLTKTGKERKDFVANISHDLRTPLSVARGYTETLLMKKDQHMTSPEQEEFLQLVYRKIR
ncbi:MAG: histidine kinase dimerization/phospho-acceptor domain-containing protein, partial [Ginsengibacter sp.]